MAVSSLGDIPFAGDFGLLWHIWIFHYLGDVISWCEFVSADYGIFWCSMSFVWMVLVTYDFQFRFWRLSPSFVSFWDIFVIRELRLDVLAMNSGPDLFLEIAVNFCLVCAEFEMFQSRFQPQLCFGALEVSNLSGLNACFVTKDVTNLSISVGTFVLVCFGLNNQQQDS